MPSADRGPGGGVAKPRTSRRTAAALGTAAWADTERLIRDALAGIGANLQLPELHEDEAAEVAVTLTRDEVQGALRTLLACRLTDAPETDAAQARTAVLLALGGTTSSTTLFCGALSEYLDERVCALVAKLEGRVGFAGLAQVRAEAYNARIVALLGAIERQVAALADPARRTQAETGSLSGTGGRRICGTGS